MKPIHFPESNFEFQKPANMPEDQCGNLPVFKGKTDEGYPVIISCFELSPEEIAEVQKTGKIWLHVCSHGMPPVFAGTEYPFKISNENQS